MDIQLSYVHEYENDENHSAFCQAEGWKRTPGAGTMLTT